MTRPQEEILAEVLNGAVICATGQVDAATKRALDKLVKAGTLAKWRGHWYPCAGANYGLGPLKTCWGLRQYLASPIVSNPSPLNVSNVVAFTR